MAIQSNNPQYNPALANILSYRNWSAGIAKLGRGFAKELMVIDALNPSGSFSVESPDGSLKVGFQPYQTQTNIVASVMQSGANLILTWTDPTYTAFRLKEEVMCTPGGYHGYVLSTAPGTVTIGTSTYPTTLDATLHFLAGTSVTALGSASGNQNSTGLTNLYMTNSYRVNYSAIYRDSHQISSRDKFFSYTGTDGVFYSFTSGEMDMVRRFMNNKVLNLCYSEPGQANGLEGVFNRYQGLKAAVRDQGGKYVPMTSLLTVADIRSDIDFMATKNPNQYQEYTVLTGRGMRSQINTLFAGSIGFTQSKAVINGNELNFTVPKLTIDGTTLQFIDWSIWNDTSRFPVISSLTGNSMESNTYCMLNTDPIPSTEGGLVPVIRKFNFAHSMVTGGAETLYRYIPGMVGPGMGNSTGGPVMGGYQFTASSIMGSQWEIAEDGGYDIQGDAMVYRHLIV